MNLSPACFASSSIGFDALESRLLFSTPRVVAYLPDYAYSSTLISKIDYSAITHLNYFSITASSKTGKLMTSDTNNPFSTSHLSNAVSKAHEHGVKVSIVVGGAGLDGSFPKIAGSDSLRIAFAKSVKSFCKTHNLQGVDLDWEPLNPTDSQITNYGKLISSLRTNTSGLVLSAAVNPEKLPIAPDNTSSRYVLNKQATKDLDLINVMAYDLDFAEHSTFTRSTNDLKSWGSYVKSNAVSKSKLIFGMPFYGRAGTSWDDSQAEGYGDIIDGYLAQSGNTPKPGADSLGVRFPDVFSNTKVTWHFNGRTTVANKTAYALDNGYGGVMFWNLGLDHYTSSGNYDKYSLLPVIKSTVKSHS